MGQGMTSLQGLGSDQYLGGNLDFRRGCQPGKMRLWPGARAGLVPGVCLGAPRGGGVRWGLGYVSPFDEVEWEGMERLLLKGFRRGDVLSQGLRIVTTVPFI